MARKKVVPVEPRYKKKKYFCSENALSTILATTEGILADQVALNKQGCYDIFTISRCLPSYLLVPISMKMLEKSIEKGYPIIASIVPDGNVCLKYESSLHSIVVFGHSTNYLYIVDAGKKGKVSKQEFLRLWERNKFLGYIRDELVQHDYPSK